MQQNEMGWYDWCWVLDSIHCKCWIPSKSFAASINITLPETNRVPQKINGRKTRKMNLLLGYPIFRGKGSIAFPFSFSLWWKSTPVLVESFRGWFESWLMKLEYMKTMCLVWIVVFFLWNRGASLGNYLSGWGQVTSLYSRHFWNWNGMTTNC